LEVWIFLCNFVPKKHNPLKVRHESVNYNFMEQKEKSLCEIVMYQPDETIRLEVRMVDDTVWLTQAQMAELFSVKEHTITYHIGNI